MEKESGTRKKQQLKYVYVAGGVGKNRNMLGGPQNFPFRPPHDFTWNCPYALFRFMSNI